MHGTIVTLIMVILTVLTIPSVNAQFNIDVFQEENPATTITPYTVTIFNGTRQLIYTNVSNIRVPDLFIYDNFEDDSFNVNNWANESEVCTALTGGRQSLITEANGTITLIAEQTGGTSQRTEIVSDPIIGNFTEILFNLTEVNKVASSVYLGVFLGDQEIDRDSNSIGDISCLPSQGGTPTAGGGISNNRNYKINTSGSNITVFRNGALIQNIVGGNLTNQRLSFVVITNTSAATTNVSMTIGFVKLDNLTFFPNMGLSDVRIETEGFTQRGYQILINDTMNRNLSAFLLSDADSTEITFTVQTGFVNQPGALITTQRFIDASFQTVEQDITDGAANALQFMLIGETYRVTASSGPNILIASIAPTNALTSFTLQLTTPAVQQLNPVLGDVSYRFDPLTSTVPFGNASVNLTVVALNSNLAIYGMNISFTYANGSNMIIFMGNDTTGAGGTISASFDLTTIFNASNFDRINITAFFNKTNSDTAIVTRSYIIFSQNATNISVFDVLNNVRATTGLTDLSASIIALFIAVLIAGFASLRLRGGAFGVGFVTIIVLGFFTFLGWFNQSMYIILILVSLGTYVLFRRGL